MVFNQGGSFIRLSVTLQPPNDAMTIKNIAVSVFAFLISIIICLLAVNLVFKGSEDMSDVFNRIIVHIAIPLSLSVIGLITVFITLFSIVILRKLSPLRMIGGQND